MNIIIFSSIILIAIIGIIFFITIKHSKFNSYNVWIIIFLFIFWVSIKLVLSHNINISSFEKKTWVYPAGFVGFQLIQVLIRVPLGILSQKIKSRQKPIFLAITIGLMMFIPALITDFSVWSIFITFIGAGVFASTYGMQNQYLSENWNLKQIFMTVGILVLIPLAGQNAASLISSTSLEINPNSLRLIIIIFVCFAFISASIYLFIFPENNNTIQLDNMSEQAKEVAKIPLKKVIFIVVKYCVVIVAFSLVNVFVYLLNNDYKFIKLVASSIGSLFGVLISFFVVRKFSPRLLAYIANIAIIASLIFGTILSFIGASFILWVLFIIILSISSTAFITITVGIFLHFDHKNPNLVLGIFLTFKSMSILIGTLVSDSILTTTLDNSISKAQQQSKMLDNFKWVFVTALILSIISLVILTFSKIKNTNEDKLFDSINFYEKEINKNELIKELRFRKKVN
ncbi:MAG: MFS transporter [Mollicutes bacterium PWAP]|nr:MFS transporter [Mollicutes bacterium PWAP]